MNIWAFFAVSAKYNKAKDNKTRYACICFPSSGRAPDRMVKLMFAVVQTQCSSISAVWDGGGVGVWGWGTVLYARDGAVKRQTKSAFMEFTCIISFNPHKPLGLVPLLSPFTRCEVNVIKEMLQSELEKVFLISSLCSLMLPPAPLMHLPRH